MDSQNALYFGIAIIATLITLWIARYSFSRRDVPGALYVAGLMLSVAVWAFSSAAEVAMVARNLKIVWAKISYFAVVSIAPLWLLFASSFSQYHRWLTRRNIFFLWIVPLITAGLVVTNEWHGLIWTSITPVSDAAGVRLVYANGLGAWVHAVYAYALLLAGSLWLGWVAIRSSQLYRRQIVVMLVAMLVPTLASLVYKLDLGSFPGLDFTPLTFILTGIILALGIFRFQILDLVPIARERLIEEMRDGVLVLDVHNRIVDINTAGCRMLGRRASEVMGCSFADVLPDYSRLLEHASEITETPIELTLNTTQFVEMYLTPLKDQHKSLSGRLIVLRDITERKQTEQALSASAQYARNIVNSSLDMIITVDNERRIVEFNRAAERTFGYTREEVLGKHIEMLYASPQQSQTTHNVAVSNETFVGEVANRRKNGEVFYSLVSTAVMRNARGERIGIVGVSRDITERKQMEDALRESEERYRLVVQNLSEGIAFADVNERFTFANPEAERIFGVPPGGLVGRYLSDFTSPEQFVIVQAQTRRRAVGEANSYELEIIRPDGTKRQLSISAGPWFDTPGQFVGTFGVFRDITERKQMENALARRDAILSAVTMAAERFLRASSWEEQIPKIIARLGRVTQVSRIYIFENRFDHDGTLYWRQRYEWVAPGITPQIDNPDLQNFPAIANGFSRWITLLEKGAIIKGHVKDLPESEREILAMQDIRSIVIVPIFAQQTWWGFMGYDECTQEREWSAAETDALVVAASILGNAIEREKVDRELHDRLRHLGLLHEITNAALATSDLRQTLQTLADRLGELLDADGCYITFWDQEQQRTIPMAASGAFRESYSTLIPQPGELTMTASVLQAGRVLVAEDCLNTPYISRRIAEMFPTRSMLGLPLIASDRKLGAALIGFNRPHHFTPAEISRASQAAGQIALAVAQAQSLAAEQRRAAELEVIRQASLSLTSTLDLSKVLDAILVNVFQLVPSAQDTHIHLYSKNQLYFGASRWADGHTGEPYATPRPDGLTYTVATSGKLIVVPDMRAHPLYQTAPPDWKGAIVGFPLKIVDQVVGVMTVAFAEPRHFPAAELRALDLLAAQAAIAIQNARTYGEVKQSADVDSLTGLYNRRGLMTMGERAFNRARRLGESLGAILFDVDFFKQVNDTYGHTLGDTVLRSIADCCRHHLRTFDIIGRYGGEEFVVLLPETNLQGAIHVAERLRRAVAEMPIVIDPASSQTIHVTISLGVAMASPSLNRLAALIEAADQAQYRAKQAGRNRVELFTPLG